MPEQILKNKPDMAHAYALMDKGFAKMHDKKPDEAKKYFQQALSNAPDNPYALLNLGVLYAQEGDSGKAADTYQQVIDLAGRKGEGGQEADAALLAAARAHLRDLRQQENATAPAPQKKEEAAPPPSKEPEPKKAEQPPAAGNDASGGKAAENKTAAPAPKK